MAGRNLPQETRVCAKLGDQPHFAGTIHDDSRAKDFGYRGALVPGISLYALMTRPVVEAWGLPWLERGTMQSHSRRPVYDGEDLVIEAAPAQHDGAALRVTMVMRDAAGRDVATGIATLPDKPAAPPSLSEFPLRPLPETPDFFDAGALLPGHRFGGAEVLVTPELLAESLAYFQQSWPGYAADGIVHPTHFQRIVSRHTNLSLSLTTPSIYVESEAQHHALARIGDRLTSAGVVTASYERKGNHYYESDNLLIANGDVPIARIRRRAIYAARRVAA